MLKRCKSKILVPAVLLLGVSACSRVKLTEQGEAVRVLSENLVSVCERIGTTTSKVMDRVVIIDRSEEKQAGELIRLARNEAAAMGGNAIVPDSEVEDGRQRFIVYKCP
ncbi:MAG: DUF4156 domain-containing protein [Cellvibrionaceae bacterium]